MAKDVTKMSGEDLQEHVTLLNDQISERNAEFDTYREKHRGETLKLTQERDQAEAELEVRKALGSMSDTAKAALAQRVAANGLESGEAFGTPGAG